VYTVFENTGKSNAYNVVVEGAFAPYEQPNQVTIMNMPEQEISVQPHERIRKLLGFKQQTETLVYDKKWLVYLHIIYSDANNNPFEDEKWFVFSWDTVSLRFMERDQKEVFEVFVRRVLLKTNGGNQ
jgi:hypothetical protein